jgi:hypothetical protein
MWSILCYVWNAAQEVNSLQTVTKAGLVIYRKYWLQVFARPRSQRIVVEAEGNSARPLQFSFAIEDD